MMLQIGAEAPDFEADTTQGQVPQGQVPPK
jgi:hypothetical protein